SWRAARRGQAARAKGTPGRGDFWSCEEFEACFLLGRSVADLRRRDEAFPRESTSLCSPSHRDRPWRQRRLIMGIMHLSSLGQAPAGGVLVGLGSSILLLFNGKIAGISGIFDGLLAPKAGDIAWRIAFCMGLLAGGAALLAFYPGAFSTPSSGPLAAVAVAGLL